MNAPRPDLPLLAVLDPEWQRLDTLVTCLSRQRAGQTLGEAELAPLRAQQAQVDALRAPDGPWAALLGHTLEAVELDALVCALAPELEPRLGWAFQGLQPGATQPWASRALVQELLALDASQAEWLRRALAPEAPLRRLGWLRLEADDPYQPLRATPALLARVCGRPVEPTPPPGASPVPGHAGWDDLVLPASRLAMLQEFLLWITQRDTVVGRWGGRARGGPVALFAGPSGTGKTLAASVIASALGWRLYRVDLGRLVSKYVGETEQNLNRLFDAAEGQPMVLQFDEADALFAKRGEVKEARDRYANLEVSHLLTRIEAHDGPCILTTNLRKQLDPAFTRRFQMVVEFPRPDAPARAALWRRLLPPQAPRSADLDPVLLGEAVALSGGSIRNAALHAAFLAAAQGQPIGLGQVAHAVWRELAKEGRELSPQDLGPLARHLPPELRDEA
ncbi:ATP-binding protein [Ideonella dechloratans]|uniref:ATP-binding protein n=1 Tax=Ideonella dechloratans TaxID=36863 RepID=UPI0035AEAE50